MKPNGRRYPAVLYADSRRRDSVLVIYRAACAAAILFFWFVPPRFCFGDSIVMPDLIRHPVHLALRFTQGHSEPFASLKDRLREETQFNIKSKIYNACARAPVEPRSRRAPFRNYVCPVLVYLYYYTTMQYTAYQYRPKLMCLNFV